MPVPTTASPLDRDVDLLPAPVGTTGEAAADLLVRAVWHAAPPESREAGVLRRALDLARVNDAHSFLVDAYPDELAGERAALAAAGAAFRTNLRVACLRLRAAGVDPILIKARPDRNETYSNFDLVVGDHGWQRSIEALRSWAIRASGHPLERTKVLLHPPSGPAAHLHRSVSWFDVPVVSATDLRARALPRGETPWRLPDRPDSLRILLAHAAFQNLALDLRELLWLRELAEADVLVEARRRSTAEGWGEAFRVACRTAVDAMAALDRMTPIRLPVALPLARTTGAGVAHALSLFRRGRPVAGSRELALRLPLAAAKWRRLRAR